jgi:hypothetical protein
LIFSSTTAWGREERLADDLVFRSGGGGDQCAGSGPEKNCPGPVRSADASGGIPSPFQNDAHRDLLTRLSADLIAGRRRLPEAADLLADFSRRRKGE